MSRFAAKLAFIHRRLWQRDGTYRAAIVLGPPPLLGGAVAVALWAGIHTPHPSATGARLPPWATVVEPRLLDAAAPPLVVQPNFILPPIGPDGLPAGFESGWDVGIAEMEIAESGDVNLVGVKLANFKSDQLTIDLARIITAGPPGKLYAGSFYGFLVIRQPGVYGLTIHVERSSEQPATCVERLAIKELRLVNKVDTSLTKSNPHTYDPVKLDLQPGMYWLGGMLSCWRGHEVVGPGRLTVMILHPGDSVLKPIGPNEVVRSRPPQGK